MRGELQDRFGEYPEEVEHLFRLVEVKITAAKIGFIKVELSGEHLSLHFPPPEEKGFYEGDEAPFQKIMGRIHEMKQFQPHLKQEGKQLKLLAKISCSEESKSRLNAIYGFLDGLKSPLLRGEG
jgi:transcription-repair coupling factor (superfamily II helicase)